MLKKYEPPFEKENTTPCEKNDKTREDNKKKAAVTMSLEEEKTAVPSGSARSCPPLGTMLSFHPLERKEGREAGPERLDLLGPILRKGKKTKRSLWKGNSAICPPL